MSRFVGIVLAVCTAVSLSAATLTVGNVAIPPGGTGTTTVSLASAGASITGLQFDLSYNRTLLTVTIAAGSSTTAAQKSVALNDLGTAQRAIVIGGQSQQSLSASGQSVFVDGPVATLTIQVAANAALGSVPLTITNVAATSANATAVALTGANGGVNVSNTYMVGDVYTYTGDTLGTFGNGRLDLNDLIIMLYAVTNAPGYKPAACSDRFDAMDTYPPDTDTVRGGDGKINLNDLILELYRVTHAPGYTVIPTRSPLGGCPSGQSLQSQTRTARAVSSRPGVVEGALVLGSAQRNGAEERVPVYLEARRDLTRVGVSFSAGDQQSQLHFVNGDAAPTVSQDNQPGVVVVGWLEGVNVRAGSRLLLGYVTGPAGMSANLKVYGTSAAGLDDQREVLLAVSGANGQDQ